MQLLLVLVMSSLGSIGSTARRWPASGPWIVDIARRSLLGQLRHRHAAGWCLSGIAARSTGGDLDLQGDDSFLIGLLGFFILERLVIWRHCHHEECDVHQASGYLILVGDALHNFMGGVAIGAAFAASTPLGVSTAFAVAAHEVPQEVGDFGILLNSGFRRGQGFALNLGSAVSTIPGAVIAFFAFSAVAEFLGIVLALSASSFLYIALADLVPSLHREWSLGALPVQVGLIGLGALVIFAVRWVAH